MIDELRPLLKKFIVFAKDNLNFKRPPRLFLKQDTANQKCMLGKTAHYDPQKMAITLYVSGRHPKDILRSFSHELVHHCQNERGDLAPEKMKTMNKNYAQENDHMRKMEKEAYLMGSMCFRDWEDGLDDKLQYKMQIAEQKFLKENKNMSVKLKRKDLKGLIEKLLEKRSLKEQTDKPAAQDKLSDRNQAAKPNVGTRKSNIPPADTKSKKLTGRAKRYYDHLVKLKRTSKGSPGMVKDPEAWKKNHLTNALGAGEIPDDFESEKTAGSKTSLEEEILDEKGCGAHSRHDDSMNITAAGKRCDKLGAKPCPEGTCDTCDAKRRALEEAKAEKDYDGDGEIESGSEEYLGVKDRAIKASMANKKKKPEKKKKKPEKKKTDESKIQTPEQENTLYESRFTGRNTRLFEKLLKEWTK